MRVLVPFDDERVRNLSGQEDERPGGGRERQRRRTRRAIVTAAAALLTRGQDPSVSEIADEADVSRRTVYQYFATLEHLLADAALEAARTTASIEPAFGALSSPEDRLEALVRVMQQGFAETETLGRTIIRLTVGGAGHAPADDRGNTTDGQAPRRGYRRVAWIEHALEPLCQDLPPERFERLVSALTLLMGWESMIVLQDTRALSAAQAEEVCVWAARALLWATTGER